MLQATGEKCHFGRRKRLTRKSTDGAAIWAFNERRADLRVIDQLECLRLTVR